MTKTTLFNCNKLILTLTFIMLGGCVSLYQSPAPIKIGNTLPSSTNQNQTIKKDQGSDQIIPAHIDTSVKPDSVTYADKKTVAIEPKIEEVNTYVVQKGENLYRIALAHNLKYQDIAKWNNLTDYSVKEGQVLFLTDQPESKKIKANSEPIVKEDKKPAAQKSDSLPTDNGFDLVWPTHGSFVSKYSIQNKGVDIYGKSGQAIVAAASGTVAYSGTGLRGYGKLIIIKHNKELLTAYAHNKVLLVKEGDVVKKGQKIAEMGSSGASMIMLHFEVRRFGKPVDPTKYLK